MTTSIPAWAQRVARVYAAFHGGGDPRRVERARVFVTKDPARWVESGLAAPTGGPARVGRTVMRMTDAFAQIAEETQR